MAPTVLVGADTGGTFTDLVAVVGGRLVVAKARSTPERPDDAVLEALRTIVPPGTAVRLHYGSTVATNALLERRGARVLLVTTAGFEDVLEIGRQDRPDLYALEPTRRPVLVPSRLRLGVRERALADGRIAVPLAAGALRAVVRAARRVDAVAICFLHSYVAPQHERRIERALRGLGLHVTASHRLLREYREYERTATTVVNAYVGPPMARHLRGLARRVRGALHVMQSNGGLIDAATAGREAVRTVLSGPAGGVVGATAIARAAGVTRLITFDMGGTSTDTSVVDGVARPRTDTVIDELPIRVPTLDIHTVGAGGGSLARIDAGGALRVGPESAGADPGPACYGRGTLPTVTDAHLVLGRLAWDRFLGGTFRLDPARAQAAIEPLARRLGWSVAAAAEGIVAVANAAMERAVRVITIERGLDPRAFTLAPFGGAGGLHGAELADALGIAEVFVPRHPGLLSAWGMLAAPTIRDFSATLRTTEPRTAALRTRVRALERAARRALPGATDVERTLDVRYVGQSYEVNVPFGMAWRETFHAAHERRFGHADPARAVEVVTLRVRVRGDGVLPPTPRPRQRRSAAPLATRTVRVGGRATQAAVYERDALGAGQKIAGPAVICEYSATTFVPPSWRLEVDRHGNLRMERRRG